MIIARYLIKEISYALLGVTFVLLLIFLSNQLVRYLKYAANGKIAANILFQLMGFEIPHLLALILPLAFYLAIIFTYARLYCDNELRVMHASGLSIRRLWWITNGLGMLLAFGVMMLTMWVNPYIASQKNQLLAKNAAAENILDTLIPGRFHVSKDDKRVIYVETITRNHKQANNVFIAEQRKNPNDPTETAWSVLSAVEGYQMRDGKTQDRFVVAQDGYRYEGTPGQNEYKIIQFDKYAVRIIEQEAGLQHQPQEVMSLPKLWQNYFNDARSAAEVQWRFAMPIATILLALLAIPLSYTRPRQGRYNHLLLALLIYVVYANLLFLSRGWVANKAISIGLGMWWVHGLLLATIILVFIWQFGKIPSLRLFKTRLSRTAA